MSEAVALCALALCLGASIARRSWAPDWLVALVAAAVLVATGVLSLRGARDAVGSLAPTVGFLAALLVLSPTDAAAPGCSRRSER